MTDRGLPILLTGTFAEQSARRSTFPAAPGVEVVGITEDVSNLGDHFGELDICAVVHGIAWAGDGDAEVKALVDEVALIRQYALPGTAIILAITDPDPALLDAAAVSGADDVLLLPQQAGTLAFAIHKARRGGEADSRDAGELAGKAVVSPRGRVVTVFSPKGGTGKTVLTTNVAAYLASRRKRTLLIDLDLQFGDAAIMLGLDPKKTLHDLVETPGDLDPGKLAAFTTRHRSGLDILAAPLLPEQAESVTEHKVLQVVEVARQAYDMVCIDTSPFFYGPMLALLRPSDELLVLCGLDVPTIKNVRLSLRTLELLGYPGAQVHIVLNRVAADLGIDAGDVEKALGVPVEFEIPNDTAVAQSVNNGTSPLLRDVGSEFGKAIVRIASSLLPELSVPESNPVRSSRQTRMLRLVTRRVMEGRV